MAEESPDVGDSRRVRALFRNVDGELADPSSVSVIVTKPDLTSTTYTYLSDIEVVRAAEGIFYIDVTFDQSGRWTGTWTATGAVEAVSNWSIVVDPVGSLGTTFTYSPAAVDDQISMFRLDLGDTDADDPLFSDEEIQALITRAGGVTAALGLAYRSLANRYGRLANFSIGGLRVEHAARAIFWGKKADAAEGDTSLPVGPAVLVGAVPRNYQPYFHTDLHDSPYTGKELPLGGEYD